MFTSIFFGTVNIEISTATDGHSSSLNEGNLGSSNAAAFAALNTPLYRGNGLSGKPMQPLSSLFIVSVTNTPCSSENSFLYSSKFGASPVK